MATIRIPGYDEPQVRAQGLPGVRVSESAPRGAFGEGIASGLDQVADVMHQANVIRTEDAVNQLRAKQLERDKTIQGLLGKNAFDPKAFGGKEGQDLNAVASAWFDADAQDVAKGLTGAQKGMFEQATKRLKLEFTGRVQNHVASQGVVVARDTASSVNDMETQNLALNGVRPDGSLDGDAIAQSLARMEAGARTYAQFAGLDAAPMVLEAKSAGHAQVLTSLLGKNQPEAARAYFDLNRKDMEPRMVQAMERQIADHVQANAIQAQADRISAMDLPIDKQDEEARKAMGGNVEGAKALQSELEHRYQVRKSAKASALQETEGRLWDMRFPTIPGQRSVSMPEIMRSKEWSSLDGEKRNELRANWERYAKRNENDPSTQIEKFATYMRILDDPQRLVSMTDSQVVSLKGLLGDKLTMSLLEDKRKAAGDLAKLQKATLNDFPFRDIAAEYGLKTKGKLDQKDEAKLGLVRSRAMDAIAAEQEATGKALLPARKEEILRGLFTEVSTKKPGEWFSHNRPLFEVDNFMELDATPEEKQRAALALQNANNTSGNPRPLDDVLTPANVNALIQEMRKTK